MEIKVEVDDVVGRLLATLTYDQSVESVVEALIDHGRGKRGLAMRPR